MVDWILDRGLWCLMSTILLLNRQVVSGLQIPSESLWIQRYVMCVCVRVCVGVCFNEKKGKAKRFVGQQQVFTFMSWVVGSQSGKVCCWRFVGPGPDPGQDLVLSRWFLCHVAGSQNTTRLTCPGGHENKCSSKLLTSDHKNNVQKFGRCGDSNYINILTQN